MKLHTLPLAALLVLTFASTGAAIPPPCEEDAMETDSTMIVEGMVSDVECVGEPVSNEEKTVTTYLSTVQVMETLKGDAMDSLSITGTVVEWVGEAPVGGWDQPAYPVGTKGKFYLVADEANSGYKLVCWNGLIEAEDSVVDGTLPECSNEDPPVDPPVDPPPAADPYTPNDCWAEKCSAEYAACKADASCVAFSLCIEKEGDAQTACFEQFQADHPNANIDDQGNHVEYKALQSCGWSACNDPDAASCAEPGKGGAVNRCGQWDDSWPCNCDDACATYGDCCADKDDVCGGDEPDPPACTPSCGNKDCGDDGCGGSCGTCQDGFSCSKAQLCVEDEPEECQDACSEGDKGCDASGVPWTCAKAGNGCFEQFAGTACAEGETCTDGTCGGGEPTPEPNGADDAGSSSSDDGGCASTAPNHTGGWVLLALVLLALALRRETDETVA